MFIITALAGGLALILYGQSIIEDIFQKASFFRLQTSLLWFSWYKPLIPLLGSAITEGRRSLLTTLNTIGRMAGANILSIKNALFLFTVMEAGSVLAVHLAAFNPGYYSLLFIAGGMLIAVLRPFEGKSITGFGFICLGIYIIGYGTEAGKNSYLGSMIITALNTSNAAAFAGALLISSVTGSKLASIGAGIGMLSAGELSIIGAVPVIFGAYMGSALSLVPACLGGNPSIHTKELIFSNLINKIINLFLGIFFIVPLAVGGYKLTSFFSEFPPLPARQLANAYMIFIAGTGISGILFIPICIKLAVRLMPAGVPAGKGLAYLKPDIKKNTPEKILSAALEEIHHIMKEVSALLEISQDVWIGDGIKASVKAKNKYESIRLLGDSFTSFMKTIPVKSWPEEQYVKEIQISGIYSNMEKIASLAGMDIPALLEQSRESNTGGLSDSGKNELYEVHRQIRNEFKTVLRGTNWEKSTDYKLSSIFTDLRKKYHTGQAEIGQQEERWPLYLKAITVLEEIHASIQKTANLKNRLS